MDQRRITYVWEDKLIEYCDKLPAVFGRASMVHDLLSAYDIFKHIKVVRSTPATYEDLKLFHSELYLEHLKTFTEVDEDYMPTKEDEEYGFGYDCSPVSDMYDIISNIAGSSVTAAKCLLLGNGVQDAYNLSSFVFTLSFHKYEPGFYPGTGSVNDIGSSDAQGYSCNFPFQAFYSDKTFIYAVDTVFTEVHSNFKPDVIVVQCGADALSRDPNGGAGLTIKGYCTCIQNILKMQKPVLLLGGGGYNHSNTARLWTAITAQIAGVTLDENIPEHTFWPKYGPDYTLTVEPLLTRDLNTKLHIDTTISTIKDNLDKYLKRCENQDKVNRKRKFELVGQPSYMIKYLEYENNGTENKEKHRDVYEFID